MTGYLRDARFLGQGPLWPARCLRSIVAQQRRRFRQRPPVTMATKQPSSRPKARTSSRPRPSGLNCSKRAWRDNRSNWWGWFSARLQTARGALLDFWQADAKGQYDNSGFRLRGHQFTDADGRYRLRSVVPGVYPGRTRHIHVKVQPAGGRVLTTQLYFPGESKNRSDGLFRKALLVRTAKNAGWLAGRFDFVVD